jgi:tape measure domain-containing protein
METYDAVRDGTDELNLTHREQIQLTENLGRALQLSNKPLQEAGGIMERLSYAMASGTISTDELKRTMRQVPELAELWTKSFGVTRAQLLSLVDSGQIGINDLVGVTVRGGEQLNASWDKQVRTVTQWREALETAFESAKARGQDNLHAMATALRENADAHISVEERLVSSKALLEKYMGATIALTDAQLAVNSTEDAWAEAAARANASMASFTDTIEKQLLVWRAYADVDPAKLLGDIDNAANKVVDVFRGLGGAVDDSIISNSVAERAKRIGEDFHRQADDQRRSLAALDLALKQGAISWDYYREHRDQAMGQHGQKDTSAKDREDREYAAGAYTASIGLEGLKRVQDSMKDMNPDVEKLKQYGEELRKIGEKDLEDAEKNRTDQLTKHWHDSLDQFERDAETKAKLVAEAFQPVEDAFKHLFETGKFSLNDFAARWRRC